MAIHSTRLFAGALTLLLCGATSVASAQPAPAPQRSSAEASAQLQYVAGRERFKVRDFKGAAENFKRALELSGSPNASFSLARCFVELGDLVAAYEMMQRSMNDAAAKAVTDPTYAQTRDAAKTELEGIEKRLGHVTIDLAAPPPDTKLTVNGKSVEIARIGQPVVVAPGHVIASASAPGRDDAKGEADVGAGETKAIHLLLGGGPAVVSVPPPPIASTDSGAPSTGPSTMRTAGFVIAGVGVIGLGVFIGTGLAASSDYSTLKNECVGHCTDPKYDSVVSHGKTLETVSNVGLVVGIAGVVGGGALIYFGGSKAKPAASIGAGPTAGGAALHFTQAF